MVLIWFAIASPKNHKPEKCLFYGPQYSLREDYFKITLVSYKLQDLLFFINYEREMSQALIAVLPWLC